MRTNSDSALYGGVTALADTTATNTADSSSSAAAAATQLLPLHYAHPPLQHVHSLPPSPVVTSPTHSVASATGRSVSSVSDAIDLEHIRLTDSPLFSPTAVPASLLLATGGAGGGSRVTGENDSEAVGFATAVVPSQTAGYHHYGQPVNIPVAAASQCSSSHSDSSKHSRHNNNSGGGSRSSSGSDGVVSMETNNNSPPRELAVYASDTNPGSSGLVAAAAGLVPAGRDLPASKLQATGSLFQRRHLVPMEVGGDNGQSSGGDDTTTSTAATVVISEETPAQSSAVTADVVVVEHSVDAQTIQPTISIEGSEYTASSAADQTHSPAAGNAAATSLHAPQPCGGSSASSHHLLHVVGDNPHAQSQQSGGSSGSGGGNDSAALITWKFEGEPEQVHSPKTAWLRRHSDSNLPLEQKGLRVTQQAHQLRSHSTG